jgi:O-6-methylguanine DNA methyltransferase
VIPVKTKWGIFRLLMTQRGLYEVRFPSCFKGKGDLSDFWRAVRGKKLDLTGCTPFQRRVYAALGKVTAGTTLSYGELAKRAGYPGAARAVGSAMKKNRLPIVIPCHRVTPVSGGIGEYSAGRKWKCRLLKLEGHQVARS